MAGMVDVVLPVLDEAAALPWVLRRMPEGFTPIVVDNGSTDGSGDIAKRLGARVVNEPRRGFGAACFAGLRAAAADVVCFMDCDATLDPHDLAVVARPVLSGEADLVLGARGGPAFSLRARITNRVLAGMVRRRVPVRLTDIGPMRAARRDGLLSLGLVDLRSGWPVEMVLRAAAAGWRVREVPVVYRARLGRSKVTGTVRGSVQAVRDVRAVLGRT